MTRLILSPVIRFARASTFASIGLFGSLLSANQPNIVFMMVDDVDRAAFEGALQVVGTPSQYLGPNIQTLADEGVVFPRQHCVSPACTPSRYNTLTGTYASRDTSGAVGSKISTYDMAIIEWNSKIQSTDTTLSRILQSNGYRTGFAGKDHVSKLSNIYKDTANSIPENGIVGDYTAEFSVINSEAHQSIYDMGFDYAESIYAKNPVDSKPDVLAVHNNDWITQGALDFLDQFEPGVGAHSGTPFFLWFSPTLTHAPYGATESWNADRLATPYGYLSAACNVIPAASTIMPRLQTHLSNPGYTPRGGDYRPHFLQLDDVVGALMAKLDALGLEDDTIIFLFNDHGVEDGKSSVYQGGTLAFSLVWKKSGFTIGSGVLNDALLSNVDFAPTILDFAQVEVPFDQFDGQSFRGILDGYTSKIHQYLYFEMGCARGIVRDEWKYIAVRYPDSILSQDPVANEIGQVSFTYGGNGLELRAMSTHPSYFLNDQLYNIVDDPTEQVNLAGNPEYAGIVAEMQAQVEKHVKPLPGDFQEFKATAGNASIELAPGTVIELF